MAIILRSTRAKAHVCETPDILAAVIDNLRSRGVTSFQQSNDASLAIDFGGMLRVGTEWHQIPGTEVSYLDHQFTTLRITLANSEVRSGSYHKLHMTNERVICLSVATVQQMQSYFKDNEARLRRLEREAVAWYSNAMANIAGHPNIQL